MDREWLMRWWPTLVAAALGASYVVLCIIGEGGRMSLDAIGARRLVVAWYAVLLVIGGAIAVMAKLPTVGMALLAAVVTLQTGWGMVRLTETSWPDYFGVALALLVWAASGHARRARSFIVPAALATTIAALLTWPTLGGPGGKYAMLFGDSAVRGLGTTLRNFFVVWALCLCVAVIVCGVGVAGRAMFRRAIQDDSPGIVSALTHRESEVYHLAAQGLSNAEIAAALFVSEATVKSHMRSIMTKTGHRSRARLIADAWQHDRLTSFARG